MKFHHALIDSKLKAAKKKATAYKLADGEGLYVLVHPNGSKYWRYNYRLDGAWKTLALGQYPEVTIKDAREKHEEAALKVARGQDPMAAKREEKKRQATFREVAAEWLNLKYPEGKEHSKTSDRAYRMVDYLNDGMGDIEITDLRVKHLSDILHKFELAGKFETRVRVQGAAVMILGYAAGRGYLDGAPHPFLGVNYAASFTAPAEEPRPAVVKADDFGHLLRKVQLREDGLTGMALNLLALTFVRPGDVNAGRWQDVDWDNAKWNVPAEQAKMRTKRKQNDSPRAGMPHEVPLARQTLELLRSLHKITGHSTFMFPGRQRARTMSENTMGDALNALGYQGVHCPHGFRSSASTILNAARVVAEDGRKTFIWPDQPALIEVQLDHDDASTRAIYNRGGCWEDRAELMQYWADTIDRLRSDGGTLQQNPTPKPLLRVVA